MSKVELFQGPTVDILVGAEKKKFTLAKALLCHRSAYFERAFNGPFKEGIEQVLELPETSVDTFQLIVQFLYTGRFVLPGRNAPRPTHAHSNAYLRFFKACDQFDLHCSKEIMDAFRHEIRENSDKRFWPSYANLQIAMEFPSNHTARKLMVGACVVPHATSLAEWTGWVAYEEQVLEFEKLVTESNNFAAELFRAYNKATKGFLKAHSLVDPITELLHHINT
ncbi:BTB POZ-like protein [Rutstroemia sp. NJR-2017a BVV2]|nr:BTB POZ-like protein [Rutstroemia sp. NJR-2017a BVV2]